MNKNSYDIVAEAVRKYWVENYPQPVIAFFFQKFDYENDNEYRWHSELVECQSIDDYKTVIFLYDFCEGETCVKDLQIVSLEDVLDYYVKNILNIQLE
jgi:hypothetical protein